MDFSVIIPAYNEKDRLPPFLAELLVEIGNAGLKGEIIIVDDGSSEAHRCVYSGLASGPGVTPVSVLRHERNLGKGAAIQTGFKAARGEWIGFVDADNAVPSSEVVRLLNISLSSSELDCVLGSRVFMLGYNIKRKFSRHFLGRIFATLLYFVLRIPVYDSQCGCKFFRKVTIMPLVALCREREYLFDVELIALGYLNKLRFLEVPINWREVAGSKVRIIQDSLKSFAGLWAVKKRVLRSARNR